MKKSFFILGLFLPLFFTGLLFSDATAQSSFKKLLTTLQDGKKVSKDGKQSLSKAEFERMLFLSNVSESDIEILDKNFKKLNDLLDEKINQKPFIKFLKKDPSLKEADRKLFEADRTRIEADDKNRLQRALKDKLAQEKLKKDKFQQDTTKRYEQEFNQLSETGIGNDTKALLELVKEAYYNGRINMTSVFGDSPSPEMQQFKAYIEKPSMLDALTKKQFEQEELKERLKAGLEVDPVMLSRSMSAPVISRSPSVDDTFDYEDDQESVDGSELETEVIKVEPHQSLYRRIYVNPASTKVVEFNDRSLSSRLSLQIQQRQEQEEERQQEKENATKERTILEQTRTNRAR